MPNRELKQLSALKFESASDAFSAFTRFNKGKDATLSMHIPKSYDMVVGPMVRRISDRKGVLTWAGKIQTSIHTPQAVQVFNRYMIR